MLWLWPRFRNMSLNLRLAASFQPGLRRCIALQPDLHTPLGVLSLCLTRRDRCPLHRGIWQFRLDHSPDTPRKALNTIHILLPLRTAELPYPGNCPNSFFFPIATKWQYLLPILYQFLPSPIHFRFPRTPMFSYLLSFATYLGI